MPRYARLSPILSSTTLLLAFSRALDQHILATWRYDQRPSRRGQTSLPAESAGETPRGTASYIISVLVNGAAVGAEVAAAEMLHAMLWHNLFGLLLY